MPGGAAAPSSDGFARGQEFRRALGQPAGNTPYELATAWAPEEEQETHQILRDRSHRFAQFLEIDLDDTAGEAYVRLAQYKGASQVTQPQATAAKGSGNARNSAESERSKAAEFQKAPAPDADPGQSKRTNRGATSGGLLSKYHSGLKRAILIQLTQNPSATDLEICRGLDADGLAELPPGWNVNRGDRLLSAPIRGIAE